MATNRSLLISLDHKNDKTQDTIEHCVDQMYEVKKILTERYGFEEKDCVIMTDEEKNRNTDSWPTSYNILKALKTIIRKSIRGDKIFLYFVGHGNRVQDEDFANDTGFIEYLVCADSTFITDHTFREVESTIPKEISFTFVAESCNSSGLIEGLHEVVGSSVIKSVIKDKKYKNKSKSERGKKKKKKKESKSESKAKAPSSSVFLASCQSNEKSSYGGNHGFRVFSYFTLTLLHLLYETNGELSLEMLVREVNKMLARTRCKGKLIKQHAGLYCNPDMAKEKFLGGMVVIGPPPEGSQVSGASSLASTFAGNLSAKSTFAGNLSAKALKISSLVHEEEQFLSDDITLGEKMKYETETGLRLVNRKDQNFNDWYSEVVVSAELIEHYDISGLYILRPVAVEIWETLQAFFDPEIKKMNVENCYFPMFVLDCHLKKDEAHNDGFKQEVAWVTKSGQSDLETHLALRPNSETIMYPYYSKWIRGHRDLPLKLNQWCNAVRWVVGDPTPFIRSHEFLWQEGHSAFATEDEAHAEALEILELYRRIYEEYLAVPVIKGTKSEMDTFGGAIYTNTVEAFIPNTGCGIQGATTHCLGQKFAEKFEVNFEDKKGEKAMVWLNSWGYSTRTIGAMVMVHGDDKGLVLPPKVASTQVIVIPVPYKDADTQGIYAACKATVNMLCEAKIRAELDSRDNCYPGRKYSEWEMKGVPLRIEIRPEDLVNKQVCVVRRDNGAKMDIANADMVEEIKKLLNNIQQNMFDVAKQKRDECIQVIHTWEEFVEALNQRKMILAPWCDEKVVELEVKDRTENEMGAAKTLCSPFDQPELLKGTKCFASGKPAKKWTYWGRSY